MLEIIQILMMDLITWCDIVGNKYHSIAYENGQTPTQSLSLRLVPSHASKSLGLSKRNLHTAALRAFTNCLLCWNNSRASSNLQVALERRHH